MANTYAEFVQALPASKDANNPWWCRVVLRPISLPIGWTLYRMGIRANAVSTAGLAVCISGAGLITHPSMAAGIAGAILLNLVGLIDCVDGNIARARKETGPRGDWLDAMIGYTTYLLLPLALGFRLTLGGEEPYEGLALALGGVAASFNTYARLAYQKYDAAHLKQPLNGVPVAASKRTSRLNDLIMKPTGLVGFMMPALLLSVATGVEFYYLAFYAVLYVAGAITSVGARVYSVLRD